MQFSWHVTNECHAQVSDWQTRKHSESLYLRGASRKFLPVKENTDLLIIDVFYIDVQFSVGLVLLQLLLAYLHIV